MEEKTFEEKMLRFEETSLRFQETVLRSLLRIEKRLTILPDHATIGDLAEVISGNVEGLGERLLSQQHRLSRSASKGGRKFTKKYRK